MHTNIQTLCDVPEPLQFGIQDPATPSLEGMIFFHNYLLFFVIVIGICVVWLLIKVAKDFNNISNAVSQKFTHASSLEIAWTIIPAIVLFFIAVPSFSLLYSLDDSTSASLTVKVVGHQWYWSYEYSDFLNDSNESICFDSYLCALDDLSAGHFRLLEVDNRMVLPIEKHIKLLVTAADVLHSWAVPSFGIKIDACPGRLSEGSLFIKRPGTFYGQCSEICGVNHGFMPIVAAAVSDLKLLSWVNPSYSFKVSLPVEKSFLNSISFKIKYENN